MTIDRFISEYVTKRGESLFFADIRDNEASLKSGIFGRSVLVIGGGGTIGSSFIKALLPFEPSELFVVDTNENALTELTRDLRSSGGVMPERYLAYPMDYNSFPFRRMFRSHVRNNGMYGFDIVANFSAHKHVRSEKDVFSIEAMLGNNVINARKLLELLKQFPPELYFCVSTDKAANPVNIMGASKRIMEDLIFSYSESFPVKTARFANVAFSNGSLPDGFLRRIEKLQPISAPSDIKRYFVSPEESGQICLIAAVLGENRSIIFPKLGRAQMESFENIGRKLLEEKGYVVLECSSEEEAVKKAVTLRNGAKEYPCFFSKADTSGEKEYEEFYTDNEQVDLNRFHNLGIIIGKPVPDIKKLNLLIDSLKELFESDIAEKESIVNCLKSYLPEFRHKETGKNLDGKM